MKGAYWQPWKCFSCCLNDRPPAHRKWCTACFKWQLFVWNFFHLVTLLYIIKRVLLKQLNGKQKTDCLLNATFLMPVTWFLVSHNIITVYGAIIRSSLIRFLGGGEGTKACVRPQNGWPLIFRITKVLQCAPTCFGTQTLWSGRGTNTIIINWDNVCFYFENYRVPSLYLCVSAAASHPVVHRWRITISDLQPENGNTRPADSVQDVCVSTD